MRDLDWVDQLWQEVNLAIPTEHVPRGSKTWTWCTNCRRSLAEFAEQHRGELRYLEIGTRLGHSLAMVCRSAKEVKIAYAVDLWVPHYGGEPNPGPEAVQRSLEALGVSNARIIFVSANSRRFLRTLEEAQFDLILVDGDHTVAGARADLEACRNLLAPGGMLVFDDAEPPLSEVFDETMGRWPEYETAYHPAPISWCVGVRS